MMLRTFVMALLAAAMAVPVAPAPAAAPAAAPAPAAPAVKLYVMDCGYIRLNDPSMARYFGVTPADTGGNVDMPVPCFLIRHGSDLLLFDAGNGDWRHSGPLETISGATYEAPKLLADQLKELGLTPADIGYVAISHFHLDHVGNVAMFPGARLLIQRRELEATLASPLPFTPASAVLRLTRPGVVPVDGDLDVFGDGSVRLLSTPGHTVGHQSLAVRLRNTGTIVLSGDLYHYRAEERLHKVPPRELTTGTAESRAKVQALLAREHGQLWIEHDLATFAGLKKAPAFYD